ncbi:hypothetical protein [Methylomonas koyamae]|uniref:hypothetical protein n=1 Tax=Methylomonas koyamae TaxID=702114 RepID=UPI0012F66459|nr:hypothetical protein [Methylomonas koyamae]
MSLSSLKIRRNARWLLRLTVLGYVTFGVLLALIFPDDGFSRLSMVDAFCSKMEMLVPSIEKYVQASDFKNVTRTVLSVMWALFPIMTSLFIASVRFKKVPELVFNNYWRRFLRNLMLSVFAITFCGGLIYLFVVFPFNIQEKVDSDFINRGTAGLKAMSHSRFWLGIVGSLEILSVTIFVWGLIAYIYASVLLIYGLFINIC